MHSLHLKIDLLTDVVTTQSNASVGPHQALPYLPGAMLLGVTARGAYGALAARDPAKSFAVFHSGKVRFGCALPDDGHGAPCVPVPLSLHYPKGGAATDSTKALAPAVRNFARKSGRGNWQPKQIRDGFVDSRLCLVRPDLRYSMRTAIGAQGQAREGFLFGLEALPRGLRLLARVDADEPELLDPVRRALLGRTLHLGRSRRAEFGEVRVTEAQPWDVKHGKAQPERALFLCLSDLCPRSPAGQPATLPAAEDLGLPAGWSMDAEHSFLRFRRYTPFNTHRNRPDLERQVIVAGSVLVFVGQGEPDRDAVCARLATGVGAYRQDGLGQLLLEPALLIGPELPRAAGAAAPAPAAAVPDATPPEDEDGLAAWLHVATAQRAAAEAAGKLAQKWVEPMSAYRLPASQWGEIRRRVRACQGDDNPGDATRKAVADFVKNATRATEGRWGQKRRVGGQTTTAADRLLVLIDEAKAAHGARSLVVPVAVELLAVDIVRRQADRALD